jgi:hypothetical protein
MWILALAACGPRSASLVDPMCGPPAVAIAEPGDGAALDAGAPTTFKAYVADDCGDDDLTTMRFAWTSSVFGRIAATTVISDTEPGAVEMTTADLTVGEHAITLEVTDAAGERASTTVDVIVADGATDTEG